MEKKYLTLIAAAVVLGVGLLLWFWFGSSGPVKNFPSEGIDIVAFGDSLVWGQGADQGKDFVSLLSKRIGRQIINLGVPGDTSAQGLSRIDQLDAYRPKVVLLLLGGNDYLRRIPREETFQNLAAIIRNIQARGAIVLLLGVRGGLLSDHFDSEFEDLSDSYETAYVSDVLDGLIGNSEYMYDSIHPNNAGYALITERIYPVLLPLLE